MVIDTIFYYNEKPCISSQ